MYFSAEFFDGQSSIPQKCQLIYNEAAEFSLKYDAGIIKLVKLSWRQTSTRLLLTSESLGKYGYIAITNAEDYQAILKLLAHVKKAKSVWYSHSFITYYGVIGLLVSCWIFMDSLVFLVPTSIEPWLEKQVRFIHLRQAEVVATDASNPTLAKIKDAFIGIDPDLQGIVITVVKSKESNAVTLPNKQVIIYSKLIEDADSIEELMGILAHEMSHVKFRHCIATHLKLSFLSAVDRIVAGGAMSNTGVIMYFLQFSRAIERQADQGAINYLEQLQLSTKGMGAFFDKIPEEKIAKFWSFELLNTHPGSHDRKQLFNRHQKTYSQSKFKHDDLTHIKNAIRVSLKK